MNQPFFFLLSLRIYPYITQSVLQAFLLLFLSLTTCLVQSIYISVCLFNLAVIKLNYLFIIIFIVSFNTSIDVLICLICFFLQFQIINNQLFTIMKNEYDFDEEFISQRTAKIKIPMVFTQQRSTLTPLNRPSIAKSQSDVMGNLHQFLEMEKQQHRAKIQQIKQKQSYIGDEVARHCAQKQKKIKQIGQREKQRVLAQCTFKPQINTKGERRNFTQFLESQYNHAKKVLAKTQNIKKALQGSNDQQTFKPKINSKKKSTVLVFHRLYDQAYKENSKTDFQPKHSFQPTITEKSKNIRRNLPINQLLYEDALRRQQKNKQILEFSNSNQNIINKPTNLRSQKYAAQKFIKEYYYVLESLQVKGGKLDYIIFNQILKTMGFVTAEQDAESKNSNKQRQLVHKAYLLLQHYQPNRRNVCVFLLALMGIYNVNPVNFEEGEKEQNNDKDFSLEQAQGRKIQKEYGLLYRNRLSSEGCRKNEEQGQIYSFHPTINKDSQQLAEKYRQQMLDEANNLLDKYPEIQFNIPENGIINHTELLVLHRMVKDVQNKRKKQDKLNKSLEECTFKPMTLSASYTLNSSKMSNQPNNMANIGAKKSFQLYNHHKDLKSKKQSLRESREIDLYDKECTFVPKINKGIKEYQAPFIPNTQQTVYRMHKGRQEQQQKKQYLQRGELKSTDRGNESVKQQKIEQQQSEQIPRLIIDVNMGDKIEQIYIFKGDEGRLNQLARQFATLHNLDRISELKLVDLLKVEIENVLEKISEDEESQDYQP